MTTPDVAALLERARAWAAEDPDDETRAELDAIVADVADGGDPTDLADRFDGHARVRHRRAARRARRRAEPDEPGRRAPRGGRARGVPPRPGRHQGQLGRDRVRRPPQLRRLRPRHRRGDDRRRAEGAGAAAAAADPAAGVRDPRVRLRRRRDGDRQPQPAAGQRLQGLPRRRQPDRAARPTRASRRGSRRSGGSPTCRAATAARCSTTSIVDRYLDTVAELAADGPRDLDIVYTPLHGVGGTSVVQVLETAGFSAPRVVAEQEQPDGTFPTVSFPNPEEPGAMDLAMALAEQRRRRHRGRQRPGRRPLRRRGPRRRTAGGCCAATRSGALLASHLLRRGKQGVYATSIVSSSLLGRMAAAAGQPYAETLTGFKWIGRVEGLAFGYEEALGYCVDPEHVKDKDGVSALLLLCELAAEAKAEGRTLDDLLDDIATEHGLHATDQVSVRVTDLAEIGRAMDRLRATPPDSLGGLAVAAGRRPQRGLRRPAPHRRPALPAGRGRPGDRPPERHRAEDQVLPRGGRPGAPRRRRRRGPDRRRRPARRPGQPTSGRPPGSRTT